MDGLGANPNPSTNTWNLPGTKPGGSVGAGAPSSGVSSTSQAGLPAAMGGMAASVANSIIRLEVLSRLIMQTNQLNPQEMGQFMRGLLKLPQDLPQAMKELATQAPKGLQQQLDQEGLETLAETDLPLKDVQQFLTEKLDQSQTRLMQLMKSQQLGQLSAGGANMGEMLQLLSQVSQSVQQSPQEALHTLMLLYLPWYPLQPPQDLEIQVGGGGEDEDAESGGGSPSVLHVYLETYGLGRVKAVFSMPEARQVEVVVTHEPVLIPLQPALLELMTQGLAEHGLMPPTFSWQCQGGSAAAANGKQTADTLQAQGGAARGLTETREANTVEPKESKAPEASQATGTQSSAPPTDPRKLTLVPGEGVPVLVVQSAYLFSRVLFELDDRHTLLSHRKQRLSS